ncbi:MAG: substrate-binding domain-containing protein, partial [Polyangia bacterium]
MNFRKITVLALAASAGAAMLSGAAVAGSVTIKGSDTMVILGQRWAEEYMKKNPGTTIQVTGGGSGTGISALINGTTDICQASRTMSQAEKEKLRERYNTTGTETVVARDGLSVYVSESNPLGELTLDQLKQIYTGKVTNWKDLGGPDAKIIVY